MKRFFLLLVIFFCTISVFAQNHTARERFIEVIGSAEQSIAADEFVLVLTIREYYGNQTPKEKISMEIIEKQLIATLKSFGIDPETLKVESVGDYWRKTDDEDYLIAKSINIPFKDMKKLNDLLKSVNTRSISQMRISNLSNKNILQHQKEIRIAALQAAKEKATYLLASLGEEIGEVISVTEMNSMGSVMYAESKRLSNVMMDQTSSPSQIEDLRKIQLKYDILVRFAIK